jgi:hypothetical protein
MKATNHLRRGVSWLLLCGAAVLIFACRAHAGDGYEEEVKVIHDSIPYAEIAFTVLFAVAVGLPGFWNARRTHLD